MRKYLFLALVALLTATGASAQKVVRLVADPWMPYNGDGKAETGYILDIAKAIFARAGYTVEYEVVPWSRAIVMARAGSFDGLIGAGTEDAPDFVFPEVSQGIGKVIFCTRAESPWKYSGIEYMNSIKLGVIKDYSYFDELDEYISENEKNPKRIVTGFGTNALEDGLRMLVSGSVDVLVEYEAVLKFAIHKLGLEGKLRLTEGPPVGEYIYIAFSPKNLEAKRLAGIVAEGMVWLRKSGELKKILAKYGLADWE